MKVLFTLIIACSWITNIAQFWHTDYESFKEGNRSGIREKKSKKVVAKAVYEKASPYDYIKYKDYGYFLVKKKGDEYNLVSMDGKEVFSKPIYKKYIPSSHMKKKEMIGEFYTFQYTNGQYVLYNFSSKSTKDFDKSITYVSTHKSVVKVEKLALDGSSKYGLYDSNGKNILPAIYDKVIVLDKGKIPSVTLVKDGKENLLNLKTKQLLLKENQVDCFLGRKVITVIKNDGGVDFYSPDFKKLTLNASRFDKKIESSNGQTIYKIYSYYGVVNESWEVVIPFYNQFIGKAGNNYVICNRISDKNIKYGIVSATNKEIVACKYDAIWPAKNGLCLTKHKDKFGFFNVKGDLVIPHQYDKLELTKDKLVIAQKLNPVSNNYEYGLLDSTGKVLLPVKDEHWFIGDNYNGMYKFRKNKKYGFINKNGKVVVEPKYDKVERFYDGFAKATLNGKDYLIDENGNSTALNFASAKGNMLVSHTFTRNKRGFSRGRYEGMFVWDKKTGNNLFYIMGYEKDKFVLQSHSTLRIPIQSLKDLIGEGDLRIEVAINKQIKDINADKLEHFAKYTAIAYNTKTGKAKVFKYDVDNGFKYSHDLKPEVINQIKSDGGEIRMAIDALPTGPESGYANVGLITAWNTNTGNNRSFIEMSPRYNRYAYWKNMSFKVPAHCLNTKGKIMMDISSYLAYGNNVNDEVVYNHFVYNTYNQEVYIHKTTCADDQFNTRYLPTISTSVALNKKVEIQRPWNTRHNTEEVYMTFNSLNYQNTVVSPVMLYVNSQTGLGYYGQIKRALPNNYLEPGYKDYDGLRKAIARVKGTSTKNPKVIANVYRINSSNFQHRFIYYNTETGAIEVLEFDAQARKYKTLVALESNPLFKK